MPEPESHGPGAACRPGLAARIGLVFLLLLAIDGCGSSRLDAYRPNAHLRDDGFVNSDGSAIEKPLMDFLRWTWQRWRDDLPRAPSMSINGYRGFALVHPDPALLASRDPRPRATWIGHATVLLQLAGRNILTDPQFSERAFMVQWAGPRRRVPVPLRLDALPHIDLVVISHNHYDHLDLASVKGLARQPGGPPQFFVPLGLAQWFREQGIESVVEIDWWDARSLGDLRVDAVPAHHWSARTPFDRRQTSWNGWLIRAAGFSVFFAGDTGYSKDFAEMRRRYGPVDLALLPVGGYEPRWFMREQHVDPAEAVRIHRDLDARLSIGIHWGTFELTDEPLDAPLSGLPAALDAQDVGRDHFVLLRHGETHVFDPIREIPR